MKNRRAFLKKVFSMTAGAGAMVLLTFSQRVFANTIEELVKPIFMAAAKYYAGSWMENTLEQMEKLGEWFGQDSEKSDDQTLAVIGTSTDGRTVALKEISDNELFIETQPNPSFTCAREEVGKVSNNINQTLEKANLGSQTRLTNAGLDINSNNSPSIDMDIALQIAQYPITQIANILDASNFLTSHGYVEAKPAELYKSLLINHLYTKLIIPVNANNDATLQSEQQTILTRITVVNDALTFLFNRRVRSTQLAKTLQDVANTAEVAIIKRLKKDTEKMSAIDLERYEVERTYLSQQWHDEIQGIQSHTALTKEMSEIIATGNKMDVDILAIDERIAMITGLLSLSEIDSNMNDDYQWGAKI